MKILTSSEAKTLYVALKNSIDPLDVFIQVLFETGARVSEALLLSSKNLIVGLELDIEPLKRSKPRRVTLSANLGAKLKRLPPDLWALAISPLATRESRRRALCRRFHRLTQSLLGRRVNLHCLRHTSFSRLYAATKDLLLVKEWAGHKSIQSTLVYMTLENLAEANKTQAAILRDLAMK